MFRTALQILNPLHPRWHYARLHAGLLALVVLAVGIAYASGFFSGAKCGEKCLPQFFRQHNHTFMHGNQGRPANIPALPPRPIKTGGTTTALSGGVHMNIVPRVVDQLNTNSCTEQEYAHALGYDISWQLQDGVRRLVSARALYDWINGTTNAANGGNGTSSDQAEAAANLHGTIRHRYYDYPTFPPASFENAPPSDLPVEQHPSWLTWLYISQGGTSDAGLANIDTALASHHIVGVGMDAYDGPSGLFQASVTGTYDTASLTNLLGRHMLTFLAFDKTKTINGVTGWYFAQQSWGTRYGLTINGQPNDGTNGGYLWVSRRLVKQLSFVAVVAHLGTHADVYPSGLHAPPTGVHRPGPADGGHKPFPPEQATIPKTGISQHASEWVREYDTTDSGVNISPTINAAASYYHLPPTFVLAVVMAESGGRQYARRWVGNYDRSCGLMQQIVSNIAAYEGITDEEAACSWEYVPAHSIWLGAAILRGDIDAYHVYPPAVWGCYNAGSSCQSPYYAGFYANYLVALSYAGGDPPAPPKPKKSHFGKLRSRVWSQFRKEHRLSFIPHTGWFPRHWRDGDFRHAGGVVQVEQWDAKRRVMTESLQGGWAFWHPGHPRWGTQWKGRSHWLR